MFEAKGNVGRRAELSSKFGNFSSRHLRQEMLCYNPPLDFASCGFWHGISDENLLGDLETCKILLAISRNFCLIQAYPFPWNHCTIYLHLKETERNVRQSHNSNSKITTANLLFFLQRVLAHER